MDFELETLLPQLPKYWTYMCVIKPDCNVWMEISHGTVLEEILAVKHPLLLALWCPGRNFGRWTCRFPNVLDSEAFC